MVMYLIVRSIHACLAESEATEKSRAFGSAVCHSLWSADRGSADGSFSEFLLPFAACLTRKSRLEDTRVNRATFD